MIDNLESVGIHPYRLSTRLDRAHAMISIDNYRNYVFLRSVEGTHRMLSTCAVGSYRSETVPVISPHTIRTNGDKFQPVGIFLIAG
jgi:hypothetical protein